MDPDENRRHRRQYRHMKSKEARERGSGDVIAATQKGHWRYDDGTTPAISVPTLPKNASLFPAAGIAESETDDYEGSTAPLTQVISRGG